MHSRTSVNHIRIGLPRAQSIAFFEHEIYISKEEQQTVTTVHMGLARENGRLNRQERYRLCMAIASYVEA